jgi:serine/threonine protein phosphatase 1
MPDILMEFKMKKIVVIGDIHGCLEELKEMMNNHILPIIDTLENAVFVGDYIDRGPNSKGVFQYVQEIPKAVMLKGNHEDMMAMELVHGKYAYWAPNGGYQTMHSYDYNEDDAYQDAQKMDKLPLTYKLGRVVVSHAGLDPYYSYEDQNPNTLIWGRNYVKYDGAYKDNLFSIYGHTPTDDIICKTNQLGIDTACVFGGKLSAVVVDEEGNWLQEFAVKSKQKSR